jgi:hypothetical protein
MPVSRADSKDLRITDHALLRYLERVRGFSFEREKQAIWEICRGVQHGRVKKDGCVFEVRNGALVTITPDTGSPNRTCRERLASMSFR